MSDSDEDLLQNLQNRNVITYANENTSIYGYGPQANSTNITGYGFPSNATMSTNTMPVNFERQRYAVSNFDQRSMTYRREVSPLSLRGMSHFGSRNYNNSVYRSGMSSRSVYNGRAASPMSVHSIDSTVSAADIVFAFNNIKYNKHDLRMIQDAYNKLIKPHRRKRIEKRRNRRLLLKGNRRKSRDSGEDGSSDSSDDCRSIRTTTCSENIPCLSNTRDMSLINQNLKTNQIVREVRENIKQNTFSNMFSINNSKPYNSKEYRLQNTTVRKDLNSTSMKLQNTTMMTQKERFTKGFLLPSERFNKSVVAPMRGEKTKMFNNTRINNVANSTERVEPESASDPEEIFKGFSHKDTQTKMFNNTRINNVANFTERVEPESDSDPEEIFKGFSHKDTQKDLNVCRKRPLDTEIIDSHNKRSKLDSPKRNQYSENCTSNSQSNDFIFAKPKMPIKKVNTRKDFSPKKTLEKSKVSVIAEEPDLNTVQSNKPIENNNNEDMEHDTHSNELHSSSDVSMRPSFIKRKLFSQKLDLVQNNNNLSTDSTSTNSPQNMYTSVLRERNKARKLVTSQSCLSRDIAGEDNNVLDLIHKIVPADQMNNTNIANSKMDLTSNKSKNNNNLLDDGKWDVTTAILNCNSQDVSDTYTDEEIFSTTHGKELTKNKDNTKISAKATTFGAQCKVAVEKLSPRTMNKALNKNNTFKLPKSQLTNTESNKTRVKDCVKSFWDTDFESDIELNAAPSWKNQGTILQKRTIPAGVSLNDTTKKASNLGISILSVRNCLNEPKLNTSIKPQKSKTVKSKTVAGTKEPVLVVKKNVENTNVLNDSEKTTTKSTIEKENCPMNKKHDGKKPKKNQDADCNIDQQQSDKPKKANTKVKKKDTTVPNQKPDNHNSLNTSKPPTKPKPKPKDNIIPETKQGKKFDLKKVSKPVQKCISKVQQQIVNVRTQPPRKSKEKSFTKLHEEQNYAKANSDNNNTKSKKVLMISMNSNNDSTNSLKTRTRPSREKLLSFNCSGCDTSRENHSNISNRSLRLIRRKKNYFEERN